MDGPDLEQRRQNLRFGDGIRIAGEDIAVKDDQIGGKAGAQRAGDVLGWVRDGSLSLRIERELPLAEAAEAHRLLESRSTSGKLLLVP